MRTRRRRSVRSAVVAFVLSLAATAMVLQSVAGIGLIEALIGRAAIQTIGIKVQERKDRGSVNERRDARLAEFEAESAGLAVKLDRGWLSPKAVKREQARLDRLREAAAEVALRERQIVSFQARRRIDRKLRSTIRDGLILATGVDKRAVDFVTSLVRGENPLEAAVAAAMSEKSVADPRQGFRDLRDRLRDVNEAAKAIGGGKTLAVRARLAEALREVTGLADGNGPPPDDKIGRLQELSDALGRAAGQLGQISEELLPASPGIARDRFVHDERWLVWDATVRSLDAPAAKQALTSAVLRRSADRTLDLADAAGLDLTEAQLASIATDAFSRWVEQRRAVGLDARGTIDIDALVRAAINEMLLSNGFAPLPEPEVTTVAKPTGTEEVEPIGRRFKGQGQWRQRAWFDGGWNSDPQECSVNLTVDVELTLWPDGSALLYLGDTPRNEFEGQTLVCRANEQAQTYAGTWVMSDSDTFATIAYGSSGESFDVPIVGLVPSGSADATVVNSGNRWHTRLELQLGEVE